jgi:hypothetical protein
MHRNPGEHREIAVVELPGIPREGEWLAAYEGCAAHVVHAVTWLVRPDERGCLVEILVK